ncbi:hypothetical protein [Senegalimassilia anaerobia]
MKRAILYEIKRAFCSGGFVVALFVALILSAAQVAMVSAPFAYSDGWQFWRNGVNGAFPPSSYNTWIGLTAYSVFTMMFYYALPLLACFPAASFLCFDVHSGYAYQVVSRIGRARYIASKIFAASLAAIVVIAVPLVLNVVATACFVPALWPDSAEFTFFVDSSNTLASVFFACPLAFIALFSALAVGLGVTCVALSYALSFLVSSRFIVLLAPMAACFALQFALQGSAIAGFAPINAILPFQPQPSIFVISAGLQMLAIVALFGVTVLQAKRFEGTR